MRRYKIDNETGWIALPATIKKVVAHFKDGHTDEMKLVDLLILNPRIKKEIVMIECYDENEDKKVTQQ